jgi:hypothetical protein
MSNDETERGFPLQQPVGHGGDSAGDTLDAMLRALRARMDRWFALLSDKRDELNQERARLSIPPLPLEEPELGPSRFESRI